MDEFARVVQVGGRKVRLTNLDKVLYPSTATTKADVIAYYSAIAETMIPHCENRAATRKRWPDGVGEDGNKQAFFQKDIGEGAPAWVQTGEIQHKDHVNKYPLVNDEATLVWLAQLAALEIHVPQWRFDNAGNAQSPDRMVFDLDPGDGVPLTGVARIAFLVRGILDDMGLPSVPVTSGGKGIHLYASLDGQATSDDIAKVAHELARALETDHPDDVTSSMKRSLRPGKVFIDWSQNNASKTTVAPYSLRGRKVPTVAAPRTWRELESPDLKQLQFDEVLENVKGRGDPLSALLVERSRTALSQNEKLSVYRSKRDAARTSEPMPAQGTDDTSDDSESERRGARAGEAGGKPTWMIHLMKPRSAGEGNDYVPMLAELGSSAEFAHLDEMEWAYEMKWDGIRALVFVEDTHVVLRSRSGADITASYPEFSDLAASVNAEAAILDAEIVALGADGAPSFELLQQRLRLKSARSISNARLSAPASLFIFDVLSLNGNDCRNLPYRQRRELLSGLIEPSVTTPAAVPDSFAGTAEEACAASVDAGLEGIVAKRRESRYQSGVRTGDWKKFPLIETAEVVVVGWRESVSDSLGFASLLLAVLEDDGELRYAGRVGTGFSNVERRRIRKLLNPLEIEDAAVDVPLEVRRDARWVRPELIGEVKSKGRTRTGSFRKPVWRGWRPDKE